MGSLSSQARENDVINDTAREINLASVTRFGELTESRIQGKHFKQLPVLEDFSVQQYEAAQWFCYFLAIVDGLFCKHSSGKYLQLHVFMYLAIASGSAHSLKAKVSMKVLLIIPIFSPDQGIQQIPHASSICHCDFAFVLK